LYVGESLADRPFFRIAAAGQAILSQLSMLTVADRCHDRGKVDSRRPLAVKLAAVPSAFYGVRGMWPHLRSLTPVVLVFIPLVGWAADAQQERGFRAGAFAIDISPLEFPVIVNGGMTERTADKINDRLHARCLVLDDGRAQVAIAVVDSCMVPRHLLDEAKEMASQATGIPTSRMLISATHTHSAPSVHGCLGSDVDEPYARFLPPQIAKGIAEAHKRLQPARIGWAFGRDEKNVACRHWLMKPGVAPTNPFGGTKDDTVMMHPGPQNPDAIRPTGEPDPDVPVISIQTKSGEPLAIYSAYSLHYVGKTQPVSADYFAVFCDEIARRVKADSNPSFMAALANATSGDMWLMDYTQPTRREYTLEGVASDVADAAFEAYQRIEHFDWVPIAMEESLLGSGRADAERRGSGRGQGVHESRSRVASRRTCPRSMLARRCS
jgi:neutral ceramidase